MAGAFDEARQVLERRLAEVEDEAARLRQAISGLGSSSEGQPSRPTPTPAGSGKSASGRRRKSTAGAATGRRKRARPGEREDQLLASIAKKPSQSVAEHAKAIGIKAQQAYPLLKRLQSQGKIKKTKTGYQST